VLSLGFDLYISHFGHYNATYGSLGAMVAVLTWLYLSSYVLLLGAELNSALDLRARRTMEQPPAPIAPPPAVAEPVVAAQDPKNSAPEQLAELVTGQVGTQALRKTGIIPFAMAMTGLTFLRQRARPCRARCWWRGPASGPGSRAPGGAAGPDRRQRACLHQPGLARGGKKDSQGTSYCDMSFISIRRRPTP
jgi:hypothetical protein